MHRQLESDPEPCAAHGEAEGWGYTRLKPARPPRLSSNSGGNHSESRGSSNLTAKATSWGVAPTTGTPVDEGDIRATTRPVRPATPAASVSGAAFTRTRLIFVPNMPPNYYIRHLRATPLQSAVLEPLERPFGAHKSRTSFRTTAPGECTDLLGGVTRWRPNRRPPRTGHLPDPSQYPRRSGHPHR